MSEIAGSAVLVGSDLDGHPATWEVTGDQPVELPGSALATQRVRAVDDGTVLIRRSLRRGSDDPALPLLDNEIRALARLTRAFPVERTRPFPSLIGYDMDSREPWALVGDYRGQPARDGVTGLLGAGLLEFAGRLFDALVRMALVEVVHNRLNLAGMYLAGTSLSIVTFEHAQLVGEHRAGRSESARSQDDLLDAGRLLYEVFTGTPVTGERPDLSEVPALRTRLEDLFCDNGSRPTAREVLLRFVGPGDVPIVETHDGLSAGRAAFEAARRQKRGGDQVPHRIAEPRPPKRKGFWSRGGAMLLLFTLLAGGRP